MQKGIMHIGLVILTSIVLEELKGIAGRWVTGQIETQIDRQTQRDTQTDRHRETDRHMGRRRTVTHNPLFFFAGKMIKPYQNIGGTLLSEAASF